MSAQDEFMAGAWGAFVLWAAKQPEMRDQFKAATGLAFMPKPRSPLEAMIDKATGADSEVARAFTRWVTETHWGLDEAPPAYRNALKEVKHGDWNMTEAQIKHMVNRFLGWKLPDSFSPDAGISFKKTYNEHTAHPAKHEPTGTNLFDATQAEAMVRFMIEGLP